MLDAKKQNHNISVDKLIKDAQDIVGVFDREAHNYLGKHRIALCYLSNCVVFAVGDAKVL